MSTPADALAEAFWTAARERRLLIQRSAAGDHQFYPRPVALGGGAAQWIEAKGAGTLLSWTLCHVAAADFPIKPPYLVCIVKLAEGPRILTLLDARPEDLSIGAAVEVQWTNAPPYFLFRPIGASSP